MNRTIDVLMDAMTNQRFIQGCEVEMSEEKLRLQKEKTHTEKVLKSRLKTTKTKSQ